MVQRLLLEVKWDEVKDWEGSEASMKGSSIKAFKTEMVSLGKGEKTVGLQVFLAENCGEEGSPHKPIIFFIFISLSEVKP